MAVQFEVARHLTAEPERVFEALTNLDGASAWMPGLVKIEPADAAPVKVGTRWRETRRMFGHEATEDFEVTTVDAPRRLGLRVVAMPQTTQQPVALGVEANGIR